MPISVHFYDRKLRTLRDVSEEEYDRLMAEEGARDRKVRWRRIWNALTGAIIGVWWGLTLLLADRCGVLPGYFAATCLFATAILIIGDAVHKLEGDQPQ